MKNYLVSVIIPIYNVEQFLDKCVESVVNQTHKNIEIILVDDESPDSCPKICDDWAKKDNRVKVIHKKNGAVSDARNSGIDNSTGDYIMFLDSDDWIDKNTIEELVKIANKECCDIVSFSLLDEYGTETKQCLTNIDYSLYNREELFCNMLKNDSIAGYVCNKMFKREIIGIERFVKELYCCEDFEFCSRIAVNCEKIAFTPAKFYHYRRRLDSMTGDISFNERKLSLLDSYERILMVYNEYAPEYSHIIERNYLKQNLNMKGRMILFDVKDKNTKAIINKNIKTYYKKVMQNGNNSKSVKLNIFITKLFPGLLLKAKQNVLSKKRG